LLVVVYWCETWSLALREEYTEGVSGKGAEDNISTKRDDVTGRWRKLQQKNVAI
jgi:hypothetical protein